MKNIDFGKNKTVDEIMDNLRNVNLKLTRHTVTKPLCAVKDFQAKCASVSAEVCRTLDTWLDTCVMNMNKNSSKAEPENIANLMMDSYLKYNDIMLEVPKLVEEFKSAPKIAKAIVDAYAEVNDVFNDVKNYIHDICETLDYDPDEFDATLAKLLIREATAKKGAGNKDAEPTE